MRGKLLGAVLIAGAALRLFAACTRQRRREVQLLGELAAALETMASVIRWQKRTLPDILSALEGYPLAGKYFWNVRNIMESGIPLQTAWKQTFFSFDAGKDVLSQLELSGDEEKLTGSLLHGAAQLRNLCRQREETRRQDTKLYLAGLLSAAGGLIILLI